MNLLHAVAPNAPAAERHPHPAAGGSLLPQGLAAELQRLERYSRSQRDPTTGLRETVEAIWKVVERAASESALDVSRSGARALLARRELVRHATCTLSAVIRRGVESGAFWPACAPWAIGRLPFALVAGACVQWVFGLSKAPSLRPSTAVAAALEVLHPGRRHENGRHLRKGVKA